ncbi:right-handed parallel beta-helix repeat-containing protein [Flavobacterium granuli]|uniref:Right handed beta helix domain-containing protein n=1 Tax=Flavobacterium granuli TaxID=280093 RepID=A0ABU1S3F2_9FLAO|nr:right-handed parallel beta-helix repeat-containing protein [Flavobacterium granuli]MDR6844684.1 hypothetical protein [Flavobacterium granuli]
MKRKLNFYLMAFLCTVSVFSQSVIYVSPKGNDKANGEKNAPLQTIQFAIDKSQKTNGNVIIELFGGNYAIDKTIVIHKNNLIIRSFENQKVSISGDITIPLSKMEKIKDKKILDRIDKDFQQKIVAIDFQSLGGKIDGLHSVGFGRPSDIGWSELVVNGEPLQLSRWPNNSMEPIGKILVSGNVKDKSEGNLPVFQFKTDRPKRWKNANEIWLSGYFAHGYADDMIKVKEMNLVDNTFHMNDFTTYEFMTGAAFRQWFAVNLLEEIDLEGEYSIDEKLQKIYFLPKGKVSELKLLRMKEPLVAIENCENVSIQNITFENSRGIGIYIEKVNGTLIDGCTIRNLGSVGICMGKGNLPEIKSDDHSMEGGGEQASRIIGSMMGVMYKNTVLDRQAGTNNGVKNCQIYNTGGGGIILSGGNRLTLESGNSFVENCKIYNYNRIEKSYRPGVWIDGVGNKITGCDIFNAPSMAILFHGNEHVIEYCKITNVCTEVDDQGAIYYGRDPSERGNIIRYNYFKELSPKHRVTATYHDDMACGSKVYGNVYFNAGSLPVLIGGGKDHHYYNNIFINSPMAIHIDNRGENWAKGMFDKDAIIDQRLQRVNYKQAPYVTKYPELVNYWEEGAMKPMRNVFDGNLFVNIENVLDGKSSWGEFYNNWMTNDDAGFVDKNNPMKGFKENAEVFNKIKGFPKLPFDKMGSTLK